MRNVVLLVNLSIAGYFKYDQVLVTMPSFVPSPKVMGSGKRISLRGLTSVEL